MELFIALIAAGTSVTIFSLVIYALVQNLTSFQQFIEKLLDDKSDDDAGDV